MAAGDLVTEQRCLYRLDHTRCGLEHAHHGPHTAEIAGRAVVWVYEEDQRIRDRGLGYGGLLARVEEEEQAATEAIEAAEVEAPPTAGPAQTSNPGVQAALIARSDQPIIRVAVTFQQGQGVDRHDAISLMVNPNTGSLRVKTRTQDITYAAGVWATLVEEPLWR